LAATAVPASAATRQAPPPPPSVPTTQPVVDGGGAVPGAPAPAPAPAPGVTGGGATFGVDPNQTPDMPDAAIVAGKAYPPADAPMEVKEAIWAGNEIVGKPYKYGGGHARVRDTGYDCSGTVSYALLGGGLLEGLPLDSSSFMSWGDPGAGDWVTVY